MIFHSSRERLSVGFFKKGDLLILHLHILRLLILRLHILHLHMLRLLILRLLILHPLILRRLIFHLHILRLLILGLLLFSRLFSSSSLVFLLSYGGRRCHRNVKKCNPFARNEGRSSKTAEKLRFCRAGRNPFARNEGRASKIAILKVRAQPFRTK